MNNLSFDSENHLIKKNVFLGVIGNSFYTDNSLFCHQMTAIIGIHSSDFISNQDANYPRFDLQVKRTNFYSYKKKSIFIIFFDNSTCNKIFSASVQIKNS